MNVQAWTFLLVAASFALYIGIAVWSRASSTKDFYVAGGGVSPLANGMATAADWMSAASFISMAGLISFMGYDGSVYLMGWTGGYVLLALLLAPFLRKFGQSERTFVANPSNLAGSVPQVMELMNGAATMVLTRPNSLIFKNLKQKNNALYHSKSGP